MYQIIQSKRGNIVVLDRDGIRLSFFEDEANTDYQRYLEWLAAGNEPEVIDS